MSHSEVSSHIHGLCNCPLCHTHTRTCVRLVVPLLYFDAGLAVLRAANVDVATNCAVRKTPIRRNGPSFYCTLHTDLCLQVISVDIQTNYHSYICDHYIGVHKTAVLALASNYTNCLVQEEFLVDFLLFCMCAAPTLAIL